MIDLKGLKLNDGNTMPQLGLGLYKVSTQAELTQVVKTAWEQGYRLFAVSYTHLTLPTN